jgi:hypothetical protein
LSIKVLAADTTSFRTALKRFLYHHSFSPWMNIISKTGHKSINI